MASEVDVEALARELNRWPWCDAMCASGDVACGVCQQQHTMLALLARLREAERALAIVKESEAESYAAYTRAAVERDEARSALAAEHATALEALRQAEAAEARVAELQATAVAPEPEAKDAATLAFDAIARAVGCPEWDYPGQLVRDVERLRKERDEARAALIRSQEDHRAAVEALETYEERIGDIADHVLGLVPPDVPSIVKLDAIERRCGEERVAARQAERERDEAREALEWTTTTRGTAEEAADMWRHRAEAAEARVAELEDADKALALVEQAHGVDARTAVAEYHALCAIADAAEALLKGQSDWHIEDCHAYGAPDEECADEPGADPHCDCGAKAQRDALRAALAARKDGG